MVGSLMSPDCLTRTNRTNPMCQQPAKPMGINDMAIPGIKTSSFDMRYLDVEKNYGGQLLQ